MAKLLEQISQQHQDHTFSDFIISEEDRAIKGSCMSDGIPCHVKIAIGGMESQRLRRSRAFNQQIGLLSPPFHIPQVIVGGVIEDNYYKVETTLRGKPFAILDQGIEVFQTTEPLIFFPQLIRAFLWIQDQDIVLPKVSESSKTSSLAGVPWMLEKMKEWIGDDTPNPSALLTVASKDPGLSTALATIDATPINTIVYPDYSVGLVDTDLAGYKAIRYYDCAEMYHRLFTRACQTELAERFLQEIIKQISSQQRLEFAQYFLAVIAFRVVGNFFEIRTVSESPQRQLRLLYAQQCTDRLISGMLESEILTLCR